MAKTKVAKTDSVDSEEVHGSYGQDVSGIIDVNVNGGATLIDVHLTGVSPLLMNAMSQASLLAIRNREKPSRMAERPTPEQEASGKLYTLADGRPHMPVKNMWACFVGAGQFIRMDAKRQVSTAKQTLLTGLMSIETPELPIYVPGSEECATWCTDIQQGRNPHGGEAVCIVRPRFDVWQLRMRLLVQRDQFPLQKAMDLVTLAGRCRGLGDGRPACKLTFGRFAITKWELVKTD